jgi:anti-sigma regulatory factor (Ser/Thr protein kinase)
VFPAEPIMVSEARRLAAQTFASWGMDAGQAELACLLVSEVVTNAVLHASVTPSPRRELDLEADGLESAFMSAPPPRIGASVGVLGPAPAPSAVGRWDGGAPAQGHGAQGQGAQEFALRLRRGAASVWVEVFDPDLRLPRIRTAAETDEGGRGLYLVEQLATRWGSRPTPEGKAVWFEIPRSGSRS